MRKAHRRDAATLAHGLDRLEPALGQRADLVDPAAEQRRLALVDVADDDDAQRLEHEAPGSQMHCSSHVTGRAQALEGVLGRGPWHGRPAPCAVVASSSAMMSSKVAALLSIGKVMSASPRER